MLLTFRLKKILLQQISTKMPILIIFLLILCVYKLFFYKSICFSNLKTFYCKEPKELFGIKFCVSKFYYSNEKYMELLSCARDVKKMFCYNLLQRISSNSTNIFFSNKSCIVLFCLNFYENFYETYVRNSFVLLFHVFFFKLLSINLIE